MFLDSPKFMIDGFKREEEINGESFYLDPIFRTGKIKILLSREYSRTRLTV